MQFQGLLDRGLMALDCTVNPYNFFIQSLNKCRESLAKTNYNITLLKKGKQWIFYGWRYLPSSLSLNITKVSLSLKLTTVKVLPLANKTELSDKNVSVFRCVCCLKMLSLNFHCLLGRNRTGPDDVVAHVQTTTCHRLVARDHEVFMSAFCCLFFSTSICANVHCCRKQSKTKSSWDLSPRV